MNKSFKILIVTPTLGTRLTLRETCKSVRDFGGGRVHHVITCPLMAIDEVSTMVSGVDIIEEGGCGVYGAVNHILKERAADYEWVGYINDDDYWLPGMDAMIDLAVTDHGNDIVYGRYLLVDQDAKPLMIASGSARYKSIPILAARKLYAFSQQCALTRSELFLSLRGFDESFHIFADNDFWIRAILGGARCRFLNKLCAAFRMQPGQLSADLGKMDSEWRRMVSQHGLDGDSWQARFEAARFRIENVKVYVSRLLKPRGRGYTVRANLG
jgi:GT2 family glycosyltransferase